MKNIIRKCFSCMLIVSMLIPMSMTPVNAAKVNNKSVATKKVSENDDNNLAKRIRYNLSAPVKYEHKEGDEINYELEIQLPKKPSEMKKEINSFVVTARLDSRLKIVNANIRNVNPVKGKVGLSISKSSGESGPNDGKINMVSFIVKDMTALKNSTTFVVDIKAETKYGTKGEKFTNHTSMVYQTVSGKEISGDEKTTTFYDGESNVLLTTNNGVTIKSKEITGETEPNITVKAYLGEKEISKCVSDKNGKFVMKIQPLQEGSRIKLVISSEEDGNMGEKYIEVTSAEKVTNLTNTFEEEERNKEESIKELKKYNVSTLRDYMEYAEKIKKFNARDEDIAKLKVSISYGEYILLKSEITTDDFKKAIQMLEEDISSIRKPYMNGLSKDKFGPNEKMTRAEIAVVLSRLINGEVPKGEFSSFKDVDNEKWYSEAIAYMEKKGILNGYADHTFKPEEGITRAEFASIIYKNLDKDMLIHDVLVEFDDVKENFWAKECIEKIAAAGIMTGRENNKFAPNEFITRAEVVTVLNKLQRREADKEFMDKYSENPFKDLDSNFWGYYEILEATGN